MLEQESSGAAFDATGKDALVVSTDRYRLTLTKRTGEILKLVDRVSGTPLIGGQGGCLWAARAAGGGPYLGGCSYQVAYAWNAAAATLTLTYKGAELDAVATIMGRPTSLDLQLELESRRGGRIENVLFPADLREDVASIRAGYAPNFLPGVRFRPAFFSRVGSNVLTYPSRWAFSDYLALDLGDSSLALYSANPAPAPIAPVTLGFVHTDGGICSGGSFCVVHAFQTWLGAGQKWKSPLVRLRVGDGARESVLAYRTDNGIDRYPALAAKVGPQLPTLVRAPLIKADLVKGLPPFVAWDSYLARLPSPALIHPVAYQPGGHDENDPDFLPPDPKFGSTADFRAAVGSAHAHGQLVMPYANISWWDSESPTLQALPPPLTLAGIAAQDETGRPLREDYGGHSGYVMSPFAPFVRQRLATMMNEWRSDVPADCVFFDQIGARPWVRDYNPAAPNPLAYDDGWIAATAPYLDRCLMVEDGWDRLASVFAGFHGGLLLMDRETSTPDRSWGAGNWEPYPLADWLLHDKVLLYQHDLYEGTMTEDLGALTWNAVFGFQLSYNWNGLTGSIDSPWLQVAGDFQRALGLRSAGKPLGSYEEPVPGIAVSRFGDLEVRANWTGRIDAIDGYGVARGGFLARAPGFVAGVFGGTFGGSALTPGDHYLIVEAAASGVTVRQPLGDDTPVAVDSQARFATAYSAEGLPLGDVPVARAQNLAVLEYRRAVAGQRVAYYRLG